MGKNRAYQKWLVLLTCGIGSFTGTMDSSIVIVAMPTLSQTFNVPVTTVIWVSVAYWLTGTSLMLSLGRLGDIVGRKKIYVLGNIISFAGLAACALSQNVGQLISARVFQSIGSAMIIANGNAILADNFSAGERGKALGMEGVLASAGLASGPFIGGILTGTLGWRSIFYVRLPLVFISGVLALIFLHQGKQDKRKVTFDIKGAVLLLLALGTLLLAINQTPRLGIGNMIIPGLYIASAVLFGSFVLVETRVASPVVDLKLFRNSLFSAAAVTQLFCYLGLAGSNFLFPFVLTGGLGYSSSQMGFFLSAVPATIIIIAPFSGWLSDRIGTRFLCSLGMAIMALSLFLLSGLDEKTAVFTLVAMLLLVGVGNGIFNPPNVSAIMNSVSTQRLGTASGMVATLRQIGNSTGVTIASSIFAARRMYYSQTRTLPTAGGVPGRAAVIMGFQDAILVAAIFSSLGFITALLRPGKPPRGATTSTIGP